ncbi:L-fucose:H+ symporter permease [Actinomyces bowdenii]|uniref:L-fucose:H+ symporter permease n=1 Tax=Actinomyces bowdenii TaxID=131109 RepID=UPI00214C01B3|nr:L-fucose:H+ symporter permease [Actinomyces bowdenii]MCR2051654.1 L-fucose:H+ symporter permease [Actinomyces bowdenii]
MSSTTTAPSGTAHPTAPSWGLIKDPTTQLPDGYLDRTPMFQYILLSICFPMWGAAASLNDILITQFKSVFTLSDFASAFVQSAFYGGYFLIAIPSSRIIRRTSYKTGLLIGLVVYIVGCTLFFPASHVATYSVFLAALFAIAVGLSFLETSANTYSSMIGPKRSSTLRLNISQTFTPLGFLAGAVLGKYLIFTDGEALHSRLASLTGLERQQVAEAALQRTLAPYRVIIVVLVILAVVVAITQFPHCKPLNHRHEEAKATIGETLSYLARNRRFRMGILTQFLYVGMQTAVWSFTIRLALNLDDTLNERTAANFVIAAFVAFFVGKFIANVLMTRFNEDLVLVAYSILGVITLLWVVLAPNMSSVYAAVLTSGLFGPCWATVYARTLDSIEDKRHTETGGAVIVMSIIGGAVVPVIQGLVSDTIGSLQVSFLVSLLCFAAVLVYFLSEYRASARREKAE